MEHYSQTPKLCIYNCQHFTSEGPKYNFMKQLDINHDEVLIKEHWLFESHLSKLKPTGVNVDADKKNPLNRRPYGGYAIDYETNIKGKLANVIWKNQCLCGVCLTINNYCSIVTLNAYLPWDNSWQGNNFATYILVMSEVE